MQYRLLGPLEVLRDGEPVELGSPKQRAVLALLLLSRGRVVSVDRLIDAVWGEHAPPSALGGLQVYVSNLRRALRDERSATSPIVRRAPGYVLDVPAGDVDLAAFLEDADEARAALETRNWAAARTAAARALERWRGPLLVDLAEDPWVQAEGAGLEERRTATRETLLTALLGTDQVAEALAEATRIRAEHPLREHATWLHLVALHRTGRSAEALEALRAYAARLDEELGLEPGLPLRDLQSAILRQDPQLSSWPRHPGEPAPTTDPAPASRPTGTPPLPRDQGSPPPHSLITEGFAANGAGSASAASAASSRENALVGRGRETEVIDGMLAEVRGGRGRWLVLTGPPGIGKTRLADETAARFRGAGGRDVWARCPEDEGTPAWWPMRQMVRALGGDPDDVLVPPGDVDADAARFAVYERVQRLLQETVGDEPRLVVVDDVQWADPMSLGCLGYLAGALTDLPLAVVLTMRDGEAGPPVQRMLESLTRAGARRVAVPPLSAADVSVLVNDVATDPVSPSEAFLLAERTGGNPLFVSEYARLPREERLGDGIPTAVRAVLGRRLAGLDPAVLQVLRTAAVIGDVLDVDLLAEVTRLDRDTLADLLDEAADEHIIVPAVGGGGYAFGHGLLREEVLAGLSGVRRQRLHARVAEALRSGGDSDRLSRRAQHLMAALPLVEAAEALDACVAAARDAEGGWNSESAAGWWQSAIEAFDLLRPDARPASERDDLLIAHLEALSRAGRGQTVLAVVESRLLDAVREGRTATAGRLAATLLRGTGAWPYASYGGSERSLLLRLEGLLPFVAQDPAANVRVLAALAVGSYYDLDESVPDRLSAQAVALAESLGDVEVLADALLGRALSFSGLHHRSQETIDLLERIGELSYPQSRTDDALRHSLMSLASLQLGRLDAVAVHTVQATAISDLMRLPVVRTQMRWMDATLALWRGDYEEAARLRDVAAALHGQTELYFRGSSDLSIACLAWLRDAVADLDVSSLEMAEPDAWEAAVAAANGDRARAKALIAVSLDTRRPTIWTTVGHAVLLGHVVADLGLAEFVPVLLERLLPLEGQMGNIGQIGLIGPIDVVLARLEHLVGREEDARRHLAAALELSAGSATGLAQCRRVSSELGL